MNEDKIAVLESKVVSIEENIKELYKRSDDTDKVINDLNISITKLSGSIETFTVKLDVSIENLATKLNEKIEQINGEIVKINCKNDKVDDREKGNSDGIKIGVIMAIVGAVIGGLVGIIFSGIGK